MIKKNIVVLDDNKNDLLMAKFVILRMGHNPILLESPKLLIDCLQKNQVSVIVLDYDMPEMTGLEVLKRVKKVKAYAKIPVVMLTGNSSPEHVKNTVVSGAIDYIVKPIDPSIFESKINKLMVSDSADDKNAWIEYQLKKNTSSEIKIFNFSQIVSLGEITLTFKTNQSYPLGHTFFSDSTLFKELEIKNPALKVESSSAVEDGYLVKCVMLGLSEAELKKIRLYHKLLSTKNSV